MVKTTYVHNTIMIPTHEVDFSHQGLEFGKTIWNRQWSRWLIEKEGKKKIREEEEKEK
jgi:hypothetical protein